MRGNRICRNRPEAGQRETKGIHLTGYIKPSIKTTEEKGSRVQGDYNAQGVKMKVRPLLASIVSQG